MAVVFFGCLLPSTFPECLHPRAVRYDRTGRGTWGSPWRPRAPTGSPCAGTGAGRTPTAWARTGATTCWRWRGQPAGATFFSLLLFYVISHGLYHHQGRRVSDRPMVFWLKILGSVAPRMGVAEPLRRPTASRGRKRPRAAARLVGTSRAACCRSRLRVNPFLVWFVSLLVVVLWCVGNPDLWDRGLVCFWGTFLLWLVYPNLPIAWAQARARITGYQPSDFPTRLRPSTTSSMSTPRSHRSVVDEEAILGGLRSGEDLPDYDYEDFEAGSTGQDRRGEDPGRDTPRTVAGTPTMETIAFSVRPLMMSRHKEFAPIGAALSQVTGADTSTSSAWR